MCKSRLRAVDPEEIEDKLEKESKLNISKYEVRWFESILPRMSIIFTKTFGWNAQVDDTIVEQKNALHQAELEFIKKQGTLRYLKHLEANKEVEDCPICQQKPEEKVC